MANSPSDQLEAEIPAQNGAENHQSNSYPEKSLPTANGSKHISHQEETPAVIKREDSQAHDGKPASDDSEAETEILGGSQKNTPMKKQIAHNAVNTSNGNTARSESPQIKINATAEKASNPSEDSHPSRKRKGRWSEGPDNRRDRVRHSGRRLGQKRARLSQSEDDDDDEASSIRSHVASEDERSNLKADIKPKLRSRRSGAITEGEEVIASVQTRDSPAELDLNSSTRQTTGSSIARSHSPRPTLRNRHRRASSFQTSTIGTDRERRSRRRLGSQEEDGPIPSPSAASMPRPKDVDRSGRTQLARSSDEGDHDKVTAILTASVADIDRTDHAGNTPLQLAACKGFADIVETLIKHGANVNSYNEYGETALKDAEDNEHDDVIAVLKAAGASLHPSEKVRAGGPKHRLHYQTPSMAKLLEYIKHRDTEGINICFEAGFIPNNECMIAAVKTRNLELVDVLLGLGGPSDPNPPKSDPSRTPMLAAIGSGCPSIVELLLNNGCNPGRLVLAGEKTYKQVARERAGPEWRQEYRILSRAMKGTRRRGSQSPSQSSPSPSPEPAKEATPTVLDKDKARAAETKQETAEELRERYLSMMPLGIRQALIDGPERPLYPITDKERQHLISLSHYPNIFTFARHDIEQLDHVDSERWMMGWQASIFLGHHRLDEIRSMVSETIPIDQGKREAILFQVPCSEQITLDFDYYGIRHEDRFEPFCQEHRMKYALARFKDSNMIARCEIFWKESREEDLIRFLHLPDDQLFWIKVNDFVDLTNSAVAPRIQGFVIRTLDEYCIDLVKDEEGNWKHPNESQTYARWKPDGLRCFMDGQWLMAPKQTPQKIQVTAYGKEGKSRKFSIMPSASILQAQADKVDKSSSNELVDCTMNNTSNGEEHPAPPK